MSPGRKIIVENGKEAVAAAKKAVKDLGALKLLTKSVEDLTDADVEELIDEGTRWDHLQKELKKFVDEAKDILKVHAEAHEWKTRAGETCTADISPSTTKYINPTEFARLLKKMDKLEVFDDTVSVKIGEAEKYIGKLSIEEIAEIETEEYGSIRLRAIKK